MLLLNKNVYLNTFKVASIFNLCNIPILYTQEQQKPEMETKGQNMTQTNTNQVINLDETVREALRERILKGELGGGYHLSELKISKDYDVSRTPVREALCALAADGLVEMIPHRGAFVANVDPQTKADQMRAYSMFLGMAASLAATNAGIEGVMELETAIGELTAAKNENSYVSAIQNLNSLILRMANSSTTTEAVAMVERRNNVANIWSGSYSQASDIQNQFNLLLGALKRNKADAAEKTMRQLALTATNASFSSGSMQEIQIPAQPLKNEGRRLNA